VTFEKETISYEYILISNIFKALPWYCSAKFIPRVFPMLENSINNFPDDFCYNVEDRTHLD